ncbi:MAG: hypothetical protein MJZ97_06070 [Bacteroidales bacterium]|nr:hypothetical protein [Bacteroidales bacterium]
MDIPVKNKNEESNDFDSKKAELERLVELCLMDGVLTDKERLVLLKKAEELGIDKDAFEIELEAELYKRNQKRDKDQIVEDGKKELYKLVDTFLEDGVLTDEDRKILENKAKNLGIDMEEFNSYLVQQENLSKRKKKDERKNTDNENNSELGFYGGNGSNEKGGKDGGNLYLKLAILAAMILIGFLIVLKCTRSRERKPVDLSVYVKENPQLVFQTVSFSKYIALCSSHTNEHLTKQTAYHVRATGRYYFELENLEVVGEKIRSDAKTINLVYHSKTAFPVSIDVDINQKDVTKVESFDPTPISDSEAEAIAQPLSFVAGGLGAWIGGKFGSSLGNDFGTIGKIIGTGTGAVAGGAAAGQITYVKTKNYFAGLQLVSGYTVEESEALIFGAKQLMAAEMLGINFNQNSWEKCENSTRLYYEQQIETRLTTILKKLGWTEVHIQFDYQNQ